MTPLFAVSAGATVAVSWLVPPTSIEALVLSNVTPVISDEGATLEPLVVSNEGATLEPLVVSNEGVNALVLNKISYALVVNVTGVWSAVIPELTFTL
ncbi:hypothetical protein WY13_02406 [Clostridium ljungdahlii]|uniref:Uncharacterized protein n=1 Tax=Clostridium ljungdahlii TaxID=1538 RepID=A0A168NWQ2_9CLOT|nr:hypothetical protein WY13_02406 [Clostridium ljungdahlii]